MIALDTSVVVRYLVGIPEAQAAAAKLLIEESEAELGVPVVALLECAHVLRTQYAIATDDAIDALIFFLQRENVRVLGVRTEAVVDALVRARSLPGRPIADALIVATASVFGAESLATFDRRQSRHGFPTTLPTA